MIDSSGNGGRKEDRSLQVVCYMAGVETREFLVETGQRAQTAELVLALHGHCRPVGTQVESASRCL